MAISFTGKTLRDALGELIDLKVREVERRIDACACRTEHDWRRYHRAEEAAADAEGEFDRAFAHLLEELGK